MLSAILGQLKTKLYANYTRNTICGDLSAIAKATINQATSFAPDPQKPIAAAIKSGSSLLLDVIRTNLGDSLHHLLTSDVANEAIQQGTAPAASNGLDDKAAQLLALQFAETKPPTKKDPDAIVALKAEIQREDKFLKAFGKQWAATKWNMTVDTGTDHFFMQSARGRGRF